MAELSRFAPAVRNAARDAVDSMVFDLDFFRLGEAAFRDAIDGMRLVPLVEIW